MDFYIVLYCDTALHTCTFVVLTSKMLNSFYSNNIYWTKWSWAEMVIGQMVKGLNSLEPLRYVTAKKKDFFYQKLILVLAITELSLGF